MNSQNVATLRWQCYVCNGAKLKKITGTPKPGLHTSAVKNYYFLWSGWQAIDEENIKGVSDPEPLHFRLPSMRQDYSDYKLHSSTKTLSYLRFTTHAESICQCTSPVAENNVDHIVRPWWCRITTMVLKYRTGKEEASYKEQLFTANNVVNMKIIVVLDSIVMKWE